MCFFYIFSRYSIQNYFCKTFVLAYSGLQLLGTDNRAIVKVRWIAILISLIVAFVGSQFVGAYPASFDLFFHHEDVPAYVDKPFSVIYIIFAILAVLINCIAKLYSIWINFQMRKISNSIPVSHLYTITKSNFNDFEEKFTLSLDSAIVMLLFIFIFIISSLTKRSLRLYFIIPAEIMFLCVIMPLYIIIHNLKMRKNLHDCCVKSVKYFIPFFRCPPRTVCPS